MENRAKTSREETPLFQWSEDALTAQTETSQYPFTRKIHRPGPGCRVLAESTVKKLEKIIQICIDEIDPKAGNIALLIAKDLDLPIADEECEKLPKLDWAHPYWSVPLETMEVLLPKMHRAQLEHAHQMAVDGVTDVLVTWELPFLEFSNGADFRLKRQVLMAPKEHQVLLRAYQCQYKPYKYREGDRTASIHRDPHKHNERGGFYAVVSFKLHTDLVKLAEAYHGQIDVITVLEPQFLTPERHKEIKEYHASRIADSNELLKHREATEAEERKIIEECEYQKRRENTLAAARQREIETQRRVDLRDGRAANADHESQYKWEHWIATKQMTDWYI